MHKLCTMGYFLSRMRDAGYMVDRLFIRYAMHDPRTWSVVIDPGCASVVCTCYQNSPGPGEFYFELSDGGQFIPGKYFRLETDSIETFITYLVKFGINNKAQPINNNNKTNISEE